VPTYAGVGSEKSQPECVELFRGLDLCRKGHTSMSVASYRMERAPLRDEALRVMRIPLSSFGPRPKWDSRIGRSALCAPPLLRPRQRSVGIAGRRSSPQPRVQKKILYGP